MTAAQERERPRITRNPNMMDGAYCVDGLRMPVRSIKSCAKEWSVEKIMAEFSLTREQVEVALAFRSRPVDTAGNEA